MDELRWFLLVVGLLIVAGIYGYGRWEARRGQGERAPRKPKSKTRREPFADDAEIDDAFSDLDAVIGEVNPVDPVERPLPLEPDEDLDFELGPQPDVADEPGLAEPGAATLEPSPAEEDFAKAAQAGLEEKVVALHMAAPEGAVFDGRQLLEALNGAGLRFGEHRIFHFYADTRQGRIAVFSAANMLEPGIFDPERLEQLQTPGLALFMQLPGPFDALAVFEQMLEAAARMAQHLGGRVLDGRRCTLTNQAAEHIREDLREYRRRAHLAARQQGL